MLDLNSGPPEVKVCLPTVPRASGVWVQAGNNQPEIGILALSRFAGVQPLFLVKQLQPATGSTFPVWGSKVLAAEHRERPPLGSHTATVAAKCSFRGGKSYRERKLHNGLTPPPGGREPSRGSASPKSISLVAGAVRPGPQASSESRRIPPQPPSLAGGFAQRLLTILARHLIMS